LSARFEIIETPLAGLGVLQRKPLGDARGFFERVFCADELQPLLQGHTLAQINRTHTTTHGTVRGMHFQHPPHAEVKFVSCLRGVVFDVAVDLRRGSPTFLQWYGRELSADNRLTMAIPEGFAHGLQTLADDCELLYLHTAAFCADAEGGVHPLDPRLAIRWPAPITELSARDRGHAMLAPQFDGLNP
jgi:dTDP-4-dehydrorhamnose 3,5-epimerase